jgi:hypothetical protein
VRFRRAERIISLSQETFDASAYGPFPLQKKIADPFWGDYAAIFQAENTQLVVVPPEDLRSGGGKNGRKRKRIGRKLK